MISGVDITGDPYATVHTILTCSLLVGMHPDQALNPIVDLALALNKPFAVVPCCVYARDFPGRKLPDGSAVRSFEELLSWFESRVADVQRVVLPFSGRNVLLFWQPPPES